MRRSPRITLFIGAVVALSVLAPARPVIAAELLSDNFESGTLQQWSTTQNFTAQQSIVATGAWAGRATTSGDSAHATATLATPQSDVYLRAFVRLVSHTGSTPLLRLRTASGKVIASLNANASNALVLKNVVTGATLNGGVTMPSGAFVELQLHVFVSGSSGMVEVWVGGVKNAPMSGTQNFGTTAVGRVVLGRNDVAAASMDVVYDDVVVSTTFVGGGGGGTPPPTPTGLTATSTTADAVGLSWNASSGATGYTVYRDGSLLNTSGSASFVDGTVQPETEYSYTVDAFNGSGSSPQSSPPLLVTTPPASSGDGIVVRAAGDIACDPSDSNYNNGNGTASKCRQKWTAQLLGGADDVLALGDTQYNCGGLSAFNQAYHPTWGQHKAMTHPILSDEDYDTSGTGCGAAGADGYFAYWGVQAGPQPGGYYSFDVGSWHIVALNSECSDVPGGCDEGSPQNNWLEQDLNASGAQCTIAMLHKPRFASKANNSQTNAAMLPFWDDLYAAGVEMVLSGDSHFYERFAPQTPQAAANANGVVQWIVGVGGKSRGGLATARKANSVKATAKTFGVLELTLHEGSYDWEFLVEGSFAFNDTGSAACH